MASSNDHYDAVANFYESAWFYKSDSDFHKWYVARVAERLAVRPGEKVIDFGGGDGVFTQSLHNTHAGLPATTMCVDPSPGMLAKVNVSVEQLFPGSPADTILSTLFIRPRLSQAWTFCWATT
jgi:ubiquinone/menaquinone biosynthesis C-methylase UbiE